MILCLSGEDISTDYCLFHLLHPGYGNMYHASADIIPYFPSLQQPYIYFLYLFFQFSDNLYLPKFMGYDNRIRTKYIAKWGVQIMGMIFQTRSSNYLMAFIMTNFTKFFIKYPNIYTIMFFLK